VARNLNEMLLDLGPDDLVTSDEYCHRAKLTRTSNSSYSSQSPENLPTVVPDSKPPRH
jgi:hypothetical protein